MYAFVDGNSQPSSKIPSRRISTKDTSGSGRNFWSAWDVETFVSEAKRGSESDEWLSIQVVYVDFCM
jgi:hypothetical protein